MKEGWIKLHRKILENPTVCKDSDHFFVWMYLLLNATHTDYRTNFEGKEIILKSGQLITGRKSISEKLNIDESKVQRILKTLKSAQQIEQQTSNRNRLITVLNWDTYQQSEQQDEQQLNNKRTTDEQQMNTNKNIKNIKNTDKDNNSDSYNDTYNDSLKENETIVEEKEKQKKLTKESKHKYGEFSKVLLTDEQKEKLISDLGKKTFEEYLKRLDEYIYNKGAKYKDHNLTIRNWVNKDNKKGETNGTGRVQQETYSDERTTSAVLSRELEKDGIVLEWHGWDLPNLLG